MNKMTQKDRVSDYLKKCGYIETSSCNNKKTAGGYIWKFKRERNM